LQIKSVKILAYYIAGTLMTLSSTR